MDWWAIIGGTAGILALATVVFVAGQYIRQLKDLVDRHEKCPIIEVQGEVKAINAKMEIFQNAMAGQLANNIRRHTRPEMDILLDKMVRQTINLPEAERLSSLLQNSIIEDEHDAVICPGCFDLVFLRALTEQRIYELAHPVVRSHR